MEVALRAPAGKFQLFLVDHVRNNQYPGKVFDYAGDAIEEARRQNNGRSPDDESYRVYDDTGHDVTFSELHVL